MPSSSSSSSISPLSSTTSTSTSIITTTNPIEKTSTGLPYWQVNVAPGERTAECPEYLRGVDANDRTNLGTLDADYALMDWPTVQQIVETNRIDKFRRLPSQLRRYLEYTWRLRRRYGSVLRFIVDERLRWGGPDGERKTEEGEEGGSQRETRQEDRLTPANPVPFADRQDYTVLFNDWPYGMVPGIVHLVIWVKFVLDEDPATGDLTPAARAAIDAFVADTFFFKQQKERQQEDRPENGINANHDHAATDVTDAKDVTNLSCHAETETQTQQRQIQIQRQRQRQRDDNVLWFRNWSALKSVHAVEHFHVLLNNPDPAFVRQITGGDVPMIDRV